MGKRRFKEKTPNFFRRWQNEQRVDFIGFHIGQSVSYPMQPGCRIEKNESKGNLVASGCNRSFEPPTSRNDG